MINPQKPVINLIKMFNRFTALFILQLSLIIPTCFVYISIIYIPIYMFYFLFIYFG